MPRAIRWLLLAVGFVVLFLAWDASLGELVREWNREADKLETQVREVSGSAQLGTELEELDDAIVGLGPVARPRRENDARAALNLAVIEVLKEYRVSEDNFDLGGGGDQLKETLTQRLVAPGNRVKRITGTLTFEASPQDAVAIIADFERRDDVASVSSVRLTKGSNRKVKVNLTLEAWAESSGRR
ncbi:MAG: hypothetical protein HKO59_00250 [Phycisphaerales bacterium]|nr:hypothetical protein [Phycisphaerae bacterium]NNF44523.1 hypothetical protein [Phycisphaerales bacterium]NNM24412.1 hypothetical protein [Phycisphaerales bacterium]